MILISKLFTWQDALVNVQPETFLGWHRKGFRLLWRWKSRPRGRPRVPTELQELICRMAQENSTWGEERVADELLIKHEFAFHLGHCGAVCLSIPAGETRPGSALEDICAQSRPRDAGL